MSTLKSHTISDFLARATGTARLYGFEPLTQALRSRAKESTRTGKGRTFPKLKQQEKNIDAMRGELVSAIETVITSIGSVREPLLVYNTNTEKGGHKKHTTFSLHILGAKESIAEALLIRVALSIVEDLGYKNHYVRINSMGNRDSSAKYLRETGNYFRRNSEELSPTLQQLLKEDVFLTADHIARRKHALTQGMPRPVEFLSAQSRRHFHEVLEYLESAELPYEIHDGLLGHRDCYSETLFDVALMNEEAKEAPSLPCEIRGGRYDEFSRRFCKTSIPAVGITFLFDELTETMHLPNTESRRAPKAFFIHLGAEARLKSISVVERLKKARVPFTHSLTGGSFSEQLQKAEIQSIPFAVIMGQREALNNTVIVRNMNNRVQDIVTIEGIPLYFKEKRGILA